MLKRNQKKRLTNRPLKIQFSYILFQFFFHNYKNTLMSKRKENKHRQKYTLDVKASAKEKYLRGLTLSEISIILNIPLRTLEKWQLLENWTKYRNCPEIKKECLRLARNGKTIAEISAIVGKSVATISRYIKTAKENEKSENK